MRANISPLMAAYRALKASEDAERAGDTDEALRLAQEAALAAMEWRDEIFIAQNK